MNSAKDTTHDELPDPCRSRFVLPPGLNSRGLTGTGDGARPDQAPQIRDGVEQRTAFWAEMSDALRAWF